MTWHYDVGIILDNTGRPIVNQTAVFRLPSANGPSAPIGVVDLNGDPATIRTSEFGSFSRFNYVSAIDDPLNPDYYVGSWGYLDCGGVIQPVASIEALNSLSLALAARDSAVAAQAAAEAAADRAGSGPGGGVTSHHELSGLDADDHLQYLTTERGDARYQLAATAAKALADAINNSSAEDRKRGNHIGLQGITTIDGLNAILNAKADRIDGHVPNSQLPTAFIKRTADQGPPTKADCIALQYPDDSYILQD